MAAADVNGRACFERKGRQESPDWSRQKMEHGAAATSSPGDSDVELSLRLTQHQKALWRSTSTCQEVRVGSVNESYCMKESGT